MSTSNIPIYYADGIVGSLTLAQFLLLRPAAMNVPARLHRPALGQRYVGDVKYRCSMCGGLGHNKRTHIKNGNPFD